MASVVRDRDYSTLALTSPSLPRTTYCVAQSCCCSQRILEPLVHRAEEVSASVDGARCSNGVTTQAKCSVHGAECATGIAR